MASSVLFWQSCKILNAEDVGYSWAAYSWEDRSIVLGKSFFGFGKNVYLSIDDDIKQVSLWKKNNKKHVKESELAFWTIGCFTRQTGPTRKEWMEYDSAYKVVLNDGFTIFVQLVGDMDVSNYNMLCDDWNKLVETRNQKAANQGRKLNWNNYTIR